MQTRVREALGRLWTSLWRRFAPIVVEAEHEEGGSRAGARRRFWAEFREGQREAEARSSKPR